MMDGKSKDKKTLPMVSIIGALVGLLTFVVGNRRNIKMAYPIPNSSYNVT